jgi:hypothetical protein
MSQKKQQDRIEDFDFGFSFDDDVASIKQEHETLECQVQILEKRLERMYDAIVPFLNNLCKNPDKPTIHWPNRVEKIEQYKKRLERILEGNDE